MENSEMMKLTGSTTVSSTQLGAEDYVLLLLRFVGGGVLFDSSGRFAAQTR